jgi:hypothetical protein
MARRSPPKTKGTPEQRAKQRAKKRKANRAAAAKERAKLGGRNYLPKEGRVKKDRERPRLSPDQMDGHVLIRARGNRTDEDCVNEILELVSGGSPLSKALAAVGLSATQFGGWRRENRYDLQARYREAKELQAESWEDDLLEEADTATQDNYHGPRIRIDTKKWLMGKNNKRYADKVTNVLEGGENPIRTIRSDMTEAEAAAAYQATLLSSKTESEDHGEQSSEGQTVRDGD